MVEGWLWGRREECESSDWECSLEKGGVERDAWCEGNEIMF